MDRIDLHTHSTFSDGTMTPEELVAQAAKAGLKAFALTDHDTADGIPRALKAGREQGIEVVPGIEFSTEYQGQDIHIVGLEPDYTASGFHEQVRLYRKTVWTETEKSSVKCSRMVWIFLLKRCRPELILPDI